MRFICWTKKPQDTLPTINLINGLIIRSMVTAKRAPWSFF